MLIEMLASLAQFARHFAAVLQTVEKDAQFPEGFDADVYVRLTKHNNATNSDVVNDFMVKIAENFDLFALTVDEGLLVEILFAWQQRPSLFATSIQSARTFYMWLIHVLRTKPRYFERFLPLAADLLVHRLRVDVDRLTFVADVLSPCLCALASDSKCAMTFFYPLAAKGCHGLLMQLLNDVDASDVVVALCCMHRAVAIDHRAFHPSMDMAAFLSLMASRPDKLQGCSKLFAGCMGAYEGDGQARTVLSANIHVFVGAALADANREECKSMDDMHDIWTVFLRFGQVPPPFRASCRQPVGGLQGLTKRSS
eukprot:TRINITY_DN1432_c0_g1_i3.p1 TRINITY_DN1432_c0_g1~~TRINITY_DN1432_c0_g1_i3.p1  ORF type:complete len:311 (-),score=3.19 TRINITY_DN1432_c0_g1_i3:307-1239(-)